MKRDKTVRIFKVYSSVAEHAGSVPQFDFVAAVDARHALEQVNAEYNLGGGQGTMLILSVERICDLTVFQDFGWKNAQR